MGPRTYAWKRSPNPRLVPGLVAVDIAYGGICGADLHYWQHGHSGSFEVKESLVLGHEVVGRMRELGEDVTVWSVGDTVAIHTATPCPEPGTKPTGMYLTQGGGLRCCTSRSGSYAGCRIDWTCVLRC